MKKYLSMFVCFALVMVVVCTCLTTPVSAASALCSVSVIDESVQTYVRSEDEQDEPTTIDEVPLYNQNDYPDIPYSQGSVATSGCGITCLAMVATYMLDEVVLPDRLALLYNGTASDNASRMENGIIGLQLAYEGKVYTKSETIEALEAGKVLIALVSADSIFTNYGHFIVLTGINEDGKYMVNDPNGYNWARYADEFENGFEEWQIFHGFCGAWVFDKSAQEAPGFKDNVVPKSNVMGEAGLGASPTIK